MKTREQTEVTRNASGVSPPEVEETYPLTSRRRPRPHPADRLHREQRRGRSVGGGSAAVTAHLRKLSRGVRVTLYMAPGQTVTCVVPHRHVDYARRTYFKWRAAKACGSAAQDWLNFFVERALTGLKNERGRLAALNLGGAVQEAVVEAFKHRFERGL